jgi:hypothetical protein
MTLHIYNFPFSWKSANFKDVSLISAQISLALFRLWAYRWISTVFRHFFEAFQMIFAIFHTKKSRFPVFMSQKLAEINLEGGWKLEDCEHARWCGFLVLGKGCWKPKISFLHNRVCYSAVNNSKQSVRYAALQSLLNSLSRSRGHLGLQFTFHSHAFYLQRSRTKWKAREISKKSHFVWETFLKINKNKKKKPLMKISVSVFFFRLNKEFMLCVHVFMSWRREGWAVGNCFQSRKLVGI